MTAITDGEQIGLFAVLAYNSGTHASPTWVTVTRAKDVSVAASKGEATLSSRASGFEYYKGALKKLGLELGYLYRRGTDAVWTLFQASFVSGTANEYWIGDDLVTLTGAKGWRFYGEVMEFPQEQPLEDGLTYKVGIKPTPNYVSSVLVEPDLYIIS